MSPGPPAEPLAPLRLGVGICALNESVALPRLLSRLVSPRDPLDRPDDIVVADGGSADRTPEIAEAGGARVIRTGRGRGVQLGAAADALLEAGADVLLFLHADSIPRISSIAALRAAFAAGSLEKGARSDEVRAAAMRQKIDDDGRIFRWIARAANARSRRGMVYGDSGLCVQASLYEEAGGFAPLPLFEDVDLSKRIRRLARVQLVENSTLVISSRRWRHEGVLRSSVRNWILRGLYECGVPPRTLLRMYRPFSKTSKPKK